VRKSIDVSRRDDDAGLAVADDLGQAAHVADDRCAPTLRRLETQLRADAVTSDPVPAV